MNLILLTILEIPKLMDLRMEERFQSDSWIQIWTWVWSDRQPQHYFHDHAAWIEIPPPYETSWMNSHAFVSDLTHEDLDFVFEISSPLKN